MFVPQKPISVTGIYALIDSVKNADFHFDGESHPFWEMVYVKDGSVGVSADERIYNLSKGDVIFHKPMEFHRIWAADGTSPHLNILTFTLSGKMSQKLENLTLSLDERQKNLVERITAKGIKAFDREKMCVISGIANETLCLEYCNYLEILLCGICAENELEFLPEDSSADSRLFSRAVVYMRENMQRKLTVDEVAMFLFVSTSRVKKLFSRYTGIGVIEYFNNMKILQARRLLSQNMTAGEVSEMLGFSNQFYFCSVFKRITGMTPSQYKKTVM